MFDLEKLVGTKLADLDKTQFGDMRVRVWHPDTIGTMDLRMDRVNICVDENEIITRAYIG